MSEQTIKDYETDLEALANSIYSTQIDLKNTIEAIDEAAEQMESARAGHLAYILNERFEINNRLKYTNEDQRKVRLQELLDTDQNYQLIKNARTAANSLRAAQIAEIEKNKNLHKAKLLVLQYYANLF